jgi:hypothetical protein
MTPIQANSPGNDATQVGSLTLHAATTFAAFGTQGIQANPPLLH